MNLEYPKICVSQSPSPRVNWFGYLYMKVFLIHFMHRHPCCQGLDVQLMRRSYYTLKSYFAIMRNIWKGS